MFYEINANLTTEIFQKNYHRNIHFIGKTVDFIEGKEAIDNYYFFSHNKFFRLTEYKDHINGKIYITDCESDKFELKTYNNEYDKVYTLPWQDTTIQSTGFNTKIKATLLSFTDAIYNNTEIYDVNTNLSNFLIITNGSVEISDATKPIGIICCYGRMRVSESEFFSELKIPVAKKTLDDKLETYQHRCSKVEAFGYSPKKIENFIL